MTITNKIKGANNPNGFHKIANAEITPAVPKPVAIFISLGDSVSQLRRSILAPFRKRGIIKNEKNWIGCDGIYARSAIPGSSRDPKLTITFQNITIPPQSPPLTLSVLIYNFQDLPFLEDSKSTLHACTIEAVAEGLCPEADLGKFIVGNLTKKELQSDIYNGVVKLSKGDDLGVDKITYMVNKTGWYCALLFPVNGVDGSSFTAVLEYVNPIGLIRGTDYPFLPLNGFLSLTYLLIGITWLVKSFMYWKDLLPLQNYCTGVIFFLMLEMAFNYGYFEDYNKTGVYSNALLVITVLLNAGRNSISFFMLLIVSLGFGVVKPTLGPTMKNCLTLTYVHFAAGVLYTAGSRVVEDLTGLAILVFILPLSSTVTIFYLWILSGLKETIEKLELRRQIVKLDMYKRLRLLLLFSVFIMGLFLVLNVISMMSESDIQWIPHVWRWRWLLLDGWMHLLYLFVASSILFIWRPTENNQRYGLDQIPTDDFDDDEDFEREINSTLNFGQDMKLRSIKKGKNDTRLSFESDDDDEDEDRENKESNKKDAVDEEDEEVMKWVESHVGEDSSAGEKENLIQEATKLR
ncbi:hypothetical protein HK098_005402 [Nowakowskiella sp. JEL0407]|nr:hypothetical protein HK098_005402 [Nowakowskiella sp. JEL0407]